MLSILPLMKYFIHINFQFYHTVLDIENITLLKLAYIISTVYVKVYYFGNFKANVLSLFPTKPPFQTKIKTGRMKIFKLRWKLKSFKNYKQCIKICYIYFKINSLYIYYNEDKLMYYYFTRNSGNLEENIPDWDYLIYCLLKLERSFQKKLPK